MKIRKKIIIASFGVFLVPMLFVGFLFYRYTAGEVTKNAIEHQANLLELLADKLDNYISQLKLLTYAMYQTDVQTMLQQPDNMDDSVGYSQRLFSYLISRINFTDADESFNTVIFVRPDGKFFSTGTSAVVPNYPFIYEDWYKAADAAAGKVLIYYPNWQPYLASPQETPAFSIVRKIYSLDGRTMLGVILIDIPANRLAKVFKTLPMPTSEQIFIVDEQDRLLYDNRENWTTGETLPAPFAQNFVTLSEKNQTISVNGEKYVALMRGLKSANWKMISMVRIDRITAIIDRIRLYGILLGSISLLAGLLLAILFSAQITKPIFLLQRHFQKFQNGELNSRIRIRRKDEMGDLLASFNEMTIRFEQLIKQNYMTQINERTAQFKALQAQIHPHFLYNTLDSIGNIARIQGVPLVQEIAVRLASMLRYTISMSNHTATLQDELDHVQAYLSIQNIRYGNKFRVDWDIQMETLSLPIIKLTLQPVVENAIYHGLEMKTGPGQILIRSILMPDKRSYLIEVHDNGNGIDPDTLLKLQKQLQYPMADMLKPSDKSGGGLGLVNVQQRIQLEYGTAYGLTIESGGEGTVVKLRLPA
jgi:two-component system sensor histidine kinase YesM